MAIADWEQTILDAFASQGMAAPSNIGNSYDSPWESGGTAGLQNIVNGGGTPSPFAFATPSAGMPAPAASAPASGGGYQQNPYLKDQANSLREQSDFALGQNLNSIRSNSVGVGGMGGSRQGVAEGIATGLANQGYTGAVANLFATDYNNSANRDVQNRGLDVTMRGQDIGWQNANRQIDNQGRLIDSQLETAGINNAWAPIINAGNVYSQFGGGSQTNSTNTGGGWGGALGGLLGGATIGAQNKWW
jgi:hypothetical protein